MKFTIAIKVACSDKRTAIAISNEVAAALEDYRHTQRPNATITIQFKPSRKRK